MIRKHLFILCCIAAFSLCVVLCFTSALAEGIDFVWAPYNGFALFEVDGKLGLMTDAGEVVVPAEYEDFMLKGEYKPFENYLGEYDFGLAEKDGKYAILDSNNRLTTDNTFDIFWKDDYYSACFPSRMDNGIYIGFYEENGKYGLFNTLGERVTEPVFELDAFNELPSRGFVNGVSPIHTEDGWGILNAKGEIVASSEYWRGVESLPNGYCIVVEWDEQFRFGEKFCLIDTEGNTILAVEYLDSREYGEGLIYVGGFRKDSDLHGYVNMEGELVITFDDDIYSGDAFSNGLAIVRAKDGYGMINRLGEFVMAPEWDQIERKPFDNGEYFQIIKDERYGIMDANDKLISEPQWDEICFKAERDKYSESGRIKEGEYTIEYFRVRKGDVWGLLDIKGNVLSEPQWKNIDVFINGGAVVMTPEKKYGFIDENGCAIGEACWDDCYKFNDGLALVSKTDVVDGEAWYTFISLDGTVFDKKWKGAGSFSEGVAVVKEDGLWGLIDTTGALIVPCQYDEIRASQDGLSWVKKDGLYGFVNTKGELVIPCQFEYASNFSEGVCVVSNEEGLDGYMDASGTLVIPYQFDYAYTFEDGLAEIGKNGVDGAMNRDFQFISGIKEPVIFSEELEI